MDDLKLYKKHGHTSPQWDELIEPGFLAFSNDNFPTALVFLQKAYDRGCRDGLVLYKLGAVYEARNKYAQATQLLSEAAPKLKKDYPMLEVTKSIDDHLGRLYYQTDQYDKALPQLLAALKTNPNDFTLLFITGQILRSKGDRDQAYAHYIRALSAPVPADVKPDPRLGLLKELMAITYEMQRFDESLKYAEQILTIDSSDALAISYKQTISKKKMMQQQESEIQKIIDQYKK